MILLKAQPVIEKIQSDLRQETAAIEKKIGRKPKLVVVIVGEDPASVIYTRKKGETAVLVGMDHETVKFPSTASSSEVFKKVQALNSDPGVDGILVQRPLPSSFKEEEVLFWVDPSKDVDAFHPIHAGRLSLGLPCFSPCTPQGVMELLRFYKIDPAGKLACVIGRSSIVGKPMSALLLQANATLLQCHSRTMNMADLTKQADILVVAAGKPGLIGASHIKKGAVVVDVGIHRTKEGKVVGDVLFNEVAPLCHAITPVPGGVGPMTISTLLQNTLRAALKEF